MPLKKTTKGSARSQVEIKEVRDNILVLPNNRYRTVLATSSVNFELQSEAEQEALIDNFQAFLNSLTAPIQVLVRIRELDIEHYLEGFKSSRKTETEEVWRKQLKDYDRFIRKLISGNRILSRRFYIIITYDDKTSGGFTLAREQLLLEQEIITKGLEKLGLAARPLSSLEILNLFYNFYRPDSAKNQPLARAIVRQKK